ncbi:MAG: tetratricopeptide repeat protein [Alphaproteobacteria bacterium]|nr:tetratricopeptide repeat protein [Alphaproteobacteria bacterium]
MRGKLFTAVVSIGLVLAGSAWAQDRDENWKRCGGSNNLDLSIGACTAIIRSGQESNDHLAAAFYDRGWDYEHEGQTARAIQDYDQAIKLRPDFAGAYNNRCWEQAIIGQLQAVLADCNQSLAFQSGNAHFLDSRGFVYLKMKYPMAAIADYDAALKIDPKIDTSLYGRGLAEHMKGDIARGDADIAAAKIITPKIAAEFIKWGVSAP